MELFNKILRTAVEGGASDIHIKPDSPVVYRINSQLVETEMTQSPTQEWLEKIIKEIVPEHFLPRLEDDREIDFSYFLEGVGRFRTNCFQQLGKWCLAMRYVVAEVPKIDGLNLPEVIKSIAEEHRGIVLVAGTTGSGKSTTLAGMIDHINTNQKRHIITMEDPVEYVFEDNQCIIEQREVGLDTPSYQHGLKHVMRQDPDVIMVGEMRDSETAQIAIQAALTGHLVFSTVHTNSAPATVTRLIDMGIEPFLVTSTIIGILSQRLVRRICPDCRTPYEAHPEELRELGIQENASNPVNLYKGQGCNNCRGTGYRGRIGIHELLVMNERVKNVIMTNSDAQAIKQQAILEGMKTLKMDGTDKVCQGFTSAEEVLSVTYEDEAEGLSFSESNL